MKKKIPLCTLLISGFFWVTGFILSATYMPLQDIETLTHEELLKFANEFSINFPLGQLFTQIGSWVFLLFLLSGAISLAMHLRDRTKKVR